jgi:hypothetical protein
LGSAIVVAQPIVLGLKLIVLTRFKVTALLVPPEVTTVTLTVPGAVSVVGTAATMPVPDQEEAAGVTSTEVLPCVNVTLPGAAWKPPPLISIGKPTGLVGVVELLTFWIRGTGSWEEPPPPQPAENPLAAKTKAVPPPMTLLNFISFSFAVTREKRYALIMCGASVVVLVSIHQRALRALTVRWYRYGPLCGWDRCHAGKLPF